MSDQSTTIQPLDADHEDLRKLYLSNIKKEVTKEEVIAWIALKVDTVTADNVLTVDMPEMKDPNKRIRICFVTMDSGLKADEVLNTLRNLDDREKELQGNTVNMKRAVPKNLAQSEPSFHEKTTKMFIANIQKQGDIQSQLEEQIYKYAPYLMEGTASPLGKITKFQLIKEKEKEGTEVKEKIEENKGYGFITCETEELADKLAIQFSSFDWACNGQKDRRIQLKKSMKEGQSQGGFRGRGRGGRGGGRGAPQVSGGQFSGGYQQAAAYGGGYGGGYGYGTYDAGYGAYGYGGQQMGYGRGGYGYGW